MLGVTPLGPGAWREERKITGPVKKDSFLPDFIGAQAQNIRFGVPCLAEHSYMIKYTF